jgi:transcriptional regulator
MYSARQPLLKGTLDLLVLKVLEEGPLHGYAIARRIEQATADVLRIEEGSLYPALHRMEHRKWIRGTWRREGRRRPSKLYRLTRSGRRQLLQELSSWERMSLAISALVGRPFAAPEKRKA